MGDQYNIDLSGYVDSYRLIRCASQITDTVIQMFRQPTAAFICDN